MAINPEADLAHWLQIFGPGRYEGRHEESRLKKIEDIIQREDNIDSRVRSTKGQIDRMGSFGVKYKLTGSNHKND